jgi:predicted RNA-binding protein YlxR (DUF448 family)
VVVASPTASDVDKDGTVISHVPIRTCIGCRQRATAAELLRVVVAPDATGEAASAHRPSEARSPSEQPGSGPVALPVVPDPRRRIPGRGAWLHPDRRCVELAERRRAFARALRVSGPLDPTPVGEYVAQAGFGTRPLGEDTTRGRRLADTPQEMKS